MTVWFTADPHLYHQKVAEIRGFTTVDEFNAAWMDSCSSLRKNDQLWILGDLTGGGHLIEALNLIGRLPGELHLILGNHDGAHPMYRDSHRKMALYYPTFTSVQLHARKSLEGTNVLLSHFPYSGDHSPNDRFREWRLRDYGTPVVHGHTHQESVLTTGLSRWQDMERFPGSNQIHVGWDTWHEPVADHVVAMYL